MKTLARILPALLLACSTAAQAQITFFGLDDPRGTFTNSTNAQSQFQSALTLFGTDNVDALTNGAPNPDLTFGATGITATTDNTIVFNDATLGVPAAVSAPNLLVDDTGDEVFTFSAPVQGFGTFLISLGDDPDATTLTFVLENTVLGTSKTVNAGPFGPNASLTNVAYFGVIDAVNPFNRVTIQSSNINDDFGYDNLTAGFAAVPEPGPVALIVGAGVGGMMLRRRKK